MACLNDEIKHRILNVYAKFVSDVDPVRLSDWLVQGGVISIEEWQRISWKNLTPPDKCRALLNHLFSTQHPRAFLIVRKVLIERNHHLLEYIDKPKSGCEFRVKPEAETPSQDNRKIEQPEKNNDDQKRACEAEKDRLLQIQKEHDDQKRAWEADKDRLLKIEKEQDDQKRAWEADKDRLLKIQKEHDDQKRAREADKDGQLKMQNELKDQNRAWEAEKDRFPNMQKEHEDQNRACEAENIRLQKMLTEFETRLNFDKNKIQRLEKNNDDEKRAWRAEKDCLLKMKDDQKKTWEGEKYRLGKMQNGQEDQKRAWEAEKHSWRKMQKELEDQKRALEAEKDHLLQMQKEHEVKERAWEAYRDRLLKIQKEHDDQKRAWEAYRDRLLKIQNYLWDQKGVWEWEKHRLLKMQREYEDQMRACEAEKYSLLIMQNQHEDQKREWESEIYCRIQILKQQENQNRACEAENIRLQKMLAEFETRLNVGSLTNDEIKHRILNNYAKFVADVEPDRLCKWLEGTNVMSPERAEEIRSENLTPQKRCRALLDFLFSTQHPRAFLIVRQALRDKNHYLVEDIDNQEQGFGIRVQPDTETFLQDKRKIEQLEKDMEDHKRALDGEKDRLLKMEKEHDDKKRAWESDKDRLLKMQTEYEDQKREWKAITDRLMKMQKEFETKPNFDERRYKSDPVLVRTIRTKAAEEGKKPINGMTILDKELFVLSAASSEVDVYDAVKLSFSRRWNLKELLSPWDIGSCNINKCLYIVDYTGIGQSTEIFRVDPNGKLIKKWSAGDDYGRLSVTDESNITLTDYNKNKLNEYSSDGQFIREINLSSGADILHPWHAIRLPSGQFMVSHGYYDDDLHRVCKVDAFGKLKMSFGGKCGSSIGQMNYPINFSVDRNGFVMVVDQVNSRILLLDPDLKFKRVILSNAEKHGLRYPVRILLDESNDRVFLVDNELDSEEEGFTDGRILVFDFISLFKSQNIFP